MPYANNQGVRVHYQVEGKGPALVLHHGFGSWLETWYDFSYVDGLKDNYQLVLMESRGHGKSDKPHDPEVYRLALRASDVVAVLDDLGICKAYFLGYSMGGWIGWGIAKYVPERFHSLIIGGAGPDELDPNEPDPWREQSIALLRQGAEAWGVTMREPFGPFWRPEWKDQLWMSKRSSPCYRGGSASASWRPCPR